MAIQIVNLADSILVGETLVVQVRVLNRGGDSIPGAPVVLVSLTPDTLGVDTARTAIIGRAVGRGEFIAKTGDLPTPVLRIPVK